ncbi:MAG: 4-hydroxybenzoate octaprenyltransferase [Gammaproteobacteria bacterium]|nr:4-hydroxybenzoate octaprenyltransferase [Gammaproteobacteria bacterium]MDE2345360.1 4-hydroxybenzoate octaprenyltransferase [Gammaproteobacteria bacterium]
MWRKLRYNRSLRHWLSFALQRSRAYLRLMRLHRPIGSFLLLWPTLWALWLAADGHPAPKQFTIFVIGVFVMRSAGCIINDFADRNFDPYVQRTRERPLATREVSIWEALVLFVLLCLTGLGLVLMLNRLTQELAVIGALLVVSYPFMKRYTYLPQPYLGLAFGWGIPMAYAAVTGGVPTVAWLIFIANIIWATVYDTMYAMVDRPDDIRIGVKSTAILFGDLDRTIIAILQVLLMLNLLMVGYQTHMSVAYYIGLGFALLFAAYQQLLIRRRNPQRCFQAFMNNNWFGAAVFAGILLHYTFIKAL